MQTRANTADPRGKDGKVEELLKPQLHILGCREETLLILSPPRHIVINDAGQFGIELIDIRFLVSDLVADALKQGVHLLL